MKRPPTIWLTQSLLMLFALLFLSAFLLNLAVLLTHLAKRKNYGRWLGVLSLLLLWGLIILIKLRPPPAGPLQYYEYNNPAQVAGAAIVQVLLHGFFLLLILRLSFSKSVRDFFRKEIGSS